MYRGETEVIFPARLIGQLEHVRGPRWRALVRQVRGLPAHAPEVVAFVLLMARLANCAHCSMDTYRAMQGCAFCARRVLERYRGSDEDLVAAYQATLDEVRAQWDGQRWAESSVTSSAG